MVHACNINCYSMEDGQAAALGIKDVGKWLPFIFDLEIVEAAKMSSDDEEDSVYNCTTIYTRSGDVYVIDTPFKVFSKLFEEYRALLDFTSDGPLEDDDNDVNL